jgi:Holliday junction resolvase-like predicted endonuclease
VARQTAIRRETLAFVEVRTRTVRDEMSALPELSVTQGKQHLLARNRAALLGGTQRLRMPVPIRRGRHRQFSRQTASGAFA